jgi:hypothetical protein
MRSSLTQWMLGILQGKATEAIIREQMHRDLPPEDLRMLLRVIRTKPLKLRTRALAVVAHLRNIPVRVGGQAKQTMFNLRQILVSLDEERERRAGFQSAINSRCAP